MSVLPVVTNPYIIQHIEHTQQEKEIRLASHLLEVECVYATGRLIQDEVFDTVRIFCAEHRIAFSLRPFNSEAFEQDREYITKLPAFHIYYKDEYEKSFYPGDNPATRIQQVLHEMKAYDKPKKSAWRWPSFSRFTWKLPKRSRIASSDGV